MEFVYVAIGVIIGVVGAIVLDVDKFSNKVAKEEEKIDTKEEHNEGK
ncbi:hypothetical protein [Sulfurovum sp.]